MPSGPCDSAGAVGSLSAGRARAPGSANYGTGAAIFP